MASNEVRSNLSTLDLVLQVVKDDEQLRSHVQFLESLEARMIEEDSTAIADFNSFVVTHNVSSDLGEKVCLYAIKFVGDQIERLQKIKALREFTAEEEKFGKIILPSILKSVSSLCLLSQDTQLDRIGETERNGGSGESKAGK